MLIKEILLEMPEDRLPLLVSELDHLFKQLNNVDGDIRTEYQFNARRHFLDRCTDGNIDKDNVARGDLIKYNDVLYTISKFIQKYQSYINRKQRWGGCIKDTENHLNIYFGMSSTITKGRAVTIIHKTISLVTIMKAENFRTSDTVRIYTV
jgi:hypothetical protein